MLNHNQQVSTSTGDIIIAFTHVPDMECAERIAQCLLEAQLAACVNIAHPSRSHYRWQGKLEEASEIMLSIKTRLVLFDAVAECIRTLHPYELPECSYIHIDGGSAEYLDWVVQETCKKRDS